MTITPAITDHDGSDLLAWDGTALSTAGFGSVILEVTAIVGTITVKGGVTNPPIYPICVRSFGDTTGSLAATITATGIYVVPAVGVLSATYSTSATVNVKWKF